MLTNHAGGNAMHLEEQLRATADVWFSEQMLSSQRAGQLERLIQGASRRRRLARVAVGAAASGLLAAALNWPAVISVASEAPLVGPFITRMADHDRGASWADSKGFVVPVDKAVTDRGYTFRIESVAADASRTIVYFTIEGPDLTAASAPTDLLATFNRSPAPRDGHGSMRWDVVDGRIVGQVNLAPLPHPTTLVGLSAADIGGVTGRWSVSFMASRTALDRLTRTIEVGKHLQGDGYDLTVHRILLAPTETRVEMTGIAAESFDLLGIELLADGLPVPLHGGAWGGHAKTTAGETHPMKFDLPFERVDGEAKQLTLRLTGVRRWVPGGPVIDLTALHSTVQFDGVSFSLSAVSADEGETTVALMVPGGDEAQTRAWRDFADWVLIDAAGTEHPVQAGRSATESLPMTFTVREEVQTPVRLEARRHTEPATGTVELSIPLE
jgi:hypothetical protein